MTKNLLFLVFFLISSSLTAQIKLKSSGTIGMGTDPDTQNFNRLTVWHNNPVSYGVFSRAYGNQVNHGVYGYVFGGSSANYAIYGSVGSTGNNKWAGYFQGNVYATGSYQSSDERLKKNINPLDGKDILSKIGQLEPVRFEFLSEPESRQKGLPVLNAKEGEHIGLSAQEVEKVFPELIIEVVNPLTDENGEPKSEPAFVTTKAIDYSGLVVALLSAMKEQQARIEELERKIAEQGN
jgi:hypothetical protein